MFRASAAYFLTWAAGWVDPKTVDRMRLLRCHATIDHQFRAGDPGWFVGRQDQHAIGDILGGTEPTHRRAIEQHLAHDGIAESLHGQRRIRKAGVH
jgi:hypothetical protein